MCSLSIYATLPVKRTEETGFCLSEDFSLPGWLLTNAIAHPSGFLIPLPKEAMGTSFGSLPWTSPPSPLFDIIAIRGKDDYWLSSNDLLQFQRIPNPLGTTLPSFYFSAWFYEEPNAKHQWYLSLEFSYPGYGGADKGQAFRLSLSNQGRLLVEAWDGANWMPKKILALRNAQEPIQGWFDFWCYPINLPDRLILLFYAENASSLTLQKEDLVIPQPQIVFWAPVRYLLKLSPLSFPIDPLPTALSPIFTLPYTPTIAPQLFILGDNADISLTAPDGASQWSPTDHGPNMRVRVSLSPLAWARRFLVKFPSSTGDSPATPTDISHKTLRLRITRSLHIQDEGANIRLKDPSLELSPSRSLPLGAKWKEEAIFLGYLQEPRAREVLSGREWEFSVEGLSFRLRNTFLPQGDAYDGALHIEVVQEICSLAGISIQVQGTSNLRLPQGTPEQGFLWQVEKGTSCLDMLQRILEFTGWQLLTSFSVDDNGYPTGYLLYRAPPDPSSTPSKAKFWRTTEKTKEEPPEGMVYLPLLELEEEWEPPEANEIWVCGMDHLGYPIVQYWLNTPSLTEPSDGDFLGYRKVFIEVNASLNTQEAVQQRLTVLIGEKGHGKRRHEWVAPWEGNLQPGDLVEMEGVEGKVMIERIEIERDGGDMLVGRYQGVGV